MTTDVLVPGELEAGVVGALLVDPDRRHELPAGFRPEHLTGLHRRLFLALEALASKAAPSDASMTTLVAAEARLSDQEAVHLSTLVGLSAGSALPQYAAQLMERTRREQVRAAAVAALEGLRKGETTDEVAGELTARVLDLGASARPEVTSLGQASGRFVDSIEAIKAGRSPRVKTGFADIDRWLYVRPGNFVVVAARAGDGKSTFGLQWAGHVAKSKRHVLLFSLEMTADELVAVNLAREARIDSRKFFDEDSAIDWGKVLQAAESLTAGTDGFLHISDAHYGLTEIARISEKTHRRLGLSLIVVDYLQLVEAELGRGANREQHVSAVSRGLKKLAQRLKVPVVALAQLSREAEKRGQTTGAAPRCRRCGTTHTKPPEDRHAFEKPLAPAPKLTDLRESGAIEQDANHVCFLHNPYKDSDIELQRVHGPYDFIIAKQRMGPKNVAVRLRANFEHSSFEPYVESQVPGGHWAEGHER